MLISELAIKLAFEQLGKPYDSGGQGPDKWDCSGLVIVIMQHLRLFPQGVDMTANDILGYYRRQGKLAHDAERGRIIFWGKNVDTIKHCALIVSPELIIGANGRSEQAVTVEHIDYRKTKYNLKEAVVIVDPYRKGV